MFSDEVFPSAGLPTWADAGAVTIFAIFAGHGIPEPGVKPVTVYAWDRTTNH